MLKLLNRWREEAEKAGHRIERIAVAFEAGRDGLWLATRKEIQAHGISLNGVPDTLATRIVTMARITSFSAIGFAHR